MHGGRDQYLQIYSMAVQIVGVSWYGYIVGTWSSLLNSFDREVKEQRRCGAARCGAVQFSQMRCNSVKCGATRCNAVR